LFDKQRSRQLAILLITNLSFLFKEIFVTIVALIDALLFILLSKNTTISKKVFANFFAKVKKLVVNLFLILSFNLVALDFVDDKKLLKTTTTIFLKSFFVLIDLSIATTTRESQKS